MSAENRFDSKWFETDFNHLLFDLGRAHALREQKATGFFQGGKFNVVLEQHNVKELHHMFNELIAKFATPDKAPQQFARKFGMFASSSEKTNAPESTPDSTFRPTNKNS
jgi:hypothetical protein